MIHDRTVIPDDRFRPEPFVRIGASQ